MKNDWRRIGKIVFWILGFLPVGLWMLWKDPVLSRSTKTRILIYSLAGTFALFAIIGMLEIRAVQSALKDSGL